MWLLHQVGEMSEAQKIPKAEDVGIEGNSAVICHASQMRYGFIKFSEKAAFAFLLVYLLRNISHLNQCVRIWKLVQYYILNQNQVLWCCNPRLKPLSMLECWRNGELFEQRVLIANINNHLQQITSCKEQASKKLSGLRCFLAWSSSSWKYSMTKTKFKSVILIAFRLILTLHLFSGCEGKFAW